MTPLALDTSAAGHAVQQAAYLAMGPERRVLEAVAMSEAVRQIRLAGLRQRWPHASEPELLRKFIQEAHGVG